MRPTIPLGPWRLALAVAYQHRLSLPPDWMAGAPESLLAIDRWLRIPRTPAVDALRVQA